MCDVGSVSQWLEQLRGGDDEAARLLWERYYARLIRLAKAKLDSFPRRSFDEQDIAAKALGDCFRSLQEGRYPELRDRSDLWRMLIRIAENEGRTQIRREMRDKRGSGGVKGDSALSSKDDLDGRQGFDQLAASAPSPEFLAEMAESTGRLLGLLSQSEKHRQYQLQQIALWKLEGYTNAEIAQRLDEEVATRTVERRLDLIRAIWSQEPA
jgi:DNA-directed RNA polymerase specialized sigma24 family protein